MWGEGLCEGPEARGKALLLGESGPRGPEPWRLELGWERRERWEGFGSLAWEGSCDPETGEGMVWDEMRPILGLAVTIATSQAASPRAPCL